MASARPISFGTLLRRYRLAAGLTQEELAERAHLSARAISDLERGVKRTPRSETLRLLTEALGIGEGERAALAAAARGRPTLAPSQSPARIPPPRTPHVLRSTTALPLVGRQHELALIARHLSGEGAPLLLLAGEPGIGKTRLLQEAYMRGGADGWTVLVGGCTRRSGQEPYSPLLETIAGFLRPRSAAQLRADLEGCAWLVRLLPELAERSIVPVPSWTLPPEQERRLMFAAVQRLLSNVAGPAGTLLVLDDLQWAGADTIHLLSALFQPPSPFDADIPVPPLRLLGAYRSTELRTHDPLGLLLAELGPMGMARRLMLGPLSSKASDELLELLLADAESDSLPPLSGDPALRERLLKRADGIPFFLVSCAQGLRSGALGASSEGTGMTGVQGTDPLPWDVAQSIRLRVSALPESAQTLLGIAAVAGRVMLRADLFAVAHQAGRELADEHVALAALEAITHASLLTDTGNQAYTFTHDLIREVVLADLTAARREAWHMRLGEALERLPESARRRRAAELAWHFLRGAEGARALPYTLAAGDQAAELYAHDEANGHFQAALALARELGAPRQEAEALEKRGHILRLLERDDEAADIFAQTIEAYRKVGDIEGVWRATGQLAGVYGILGMPEKGRALLQPVIEATQQSTSSKALAAMYLEFSWLSWLSDDLEERLAIAEQTVRVAATAGESRIQGEAEFQRGNTLLMLGRVDEALRSLERAVPLLETTSHLRRLCSTLNVIAGIQMIRGEFGAMRIYSDRALEIAMTVGVRSQLRYTWTNQGDIAFLLGDWKRAEAAYEQAMNLCDQDSDRLESSQVFGGLGLLHFCKGATAEGIDLLERAISHATMQGAMDTEQSLAAHAVLAEWDLLTGHAQKAHDRLAPLIASLHHQEIFMTRWLPLLAWSALDSGARNEAETLLAEALERAAAQSHRLALVDILRIQALLAIRTGDWKTAENALDDALAATRTIPYPYAEAKTLYVYGLLHNARATPQLAREDFAAALAICARLGERLYAEHVERSLAGLS